MFGRFDRVALIIEHHRKHPREGKDIKPLVCLLVASEEQIGPKERRVWTNVPTWKSELCQAKHEQSQTFFKARKTLANELFLIPFREALFSSINELNTSARASMRSVQDECEVKFGNAMRATE